MKKVLAATLICAVSSFATWDLFPAQDAGKGEAKVGVQYGMQGEEVSSVGINIGARYTVIEGLEIALMLNKDPGGFVVSRSVPDAPSIPSVPGVVLPPVAGLASEDSKGLNQPIIGVRYWLPFGLGIAVDATLPFGSEDLVGEEPQFALDAGVQYSIKINEQLSIGSKALVTVINKANKDFSNGLDLDFAAEVDYSAGPATPFVGIDLQQGLTKGDKDEASKFKLGLSVGTIYDINQSMYADAGFWIGLAGDAYKDYSPKTIYVDYGIKF